eukprot:CAMPEP_0168533258 /NCGR_PEP_ID=MMETSP0405-20121227/16948_1 /TAXON_ID=498012 /ORGANISM="Trichosphaerium sp, Strain Am-I-7 wt" /LENGTH=149 /DNA_ID=CAMNT_0008559241 /DNA_START=233 /DNA_END=680 /DNA_ORIENTATION=+
MVERSSIDVTRDLLDGTWHHMALTFSEIDYTFYIDGTVAGGINTAQCCMLHGREPIEIGDRLNIEIDEISYYTSSLVRDDITSIFAAGREGKCTEQHLSTPSTTLPSTATIKVTTLESLGATCSNNSFCVFLNQNVELAGELDLRGITI